ncbi:Chromosome-partitioning ATPase Soj [Thalassocella blandensis]|nr:Chromosome-partitioning ATPase Soj [Thalassocella blandensis]
MAQVFIANPKGGCGKTTIAVQIAAYYAGLHQPVMLVDHDPQKSSADWLRERPKSRPEILFSSATVGETVAVNGARCVVHDMPAAWSLAQADGLIQRCDKVIIPVLPSPNDIRACLHFVMGLYRSGFLGSGVDVGLVANRVRGNTRYFSVLEEFLQKLRLPLIGVLRDTQNYVNAMDGGLSIFELPASKVKIDLAQWEPVLAWLETSPSPAFE